MDWLDFLAGMFVGALIGFLAAALFRASSREPPKRYPEA